MVDVPGAGDLAGRLHPHGHGLQMREGPVVKGAHTRSGEVRMETRKTKRRGAMRGLAGGG